MKRVLYLWICLMLCVVSVNAQDQVIYVSDQGNDATWTGSQTQPYKTIYKALETAPPTGTVEIRVAVGIYPISMVKGSKKGQLVIPAHVTVKGGYLRGEASSVQNVLAPDRDIPAGQTILQGDSTCRVALVKGGLEQVVVTGGRADGANGGGVFVESGGTVKNCIIHENQAAGLAPKVGDLLMKNGDYLDVSLFTYDQKDEVAGVIFWVNPKRDAPQGERGKAVSMKQLHAFLIAPVGYTSSKSNILKREWTCIDGHIPDIQPYFSMEDALRDMDGKAHTDVWLSKATSCAEFPLINDCRALGGQWYLPAVGELMLMLAEWSVVDDTFSVLWEKIRTGAGANLDIVRDYFGLERLTQINTWYEMPDIGWNAVSPIVSSTSSGTQTVWRVESFSNLSDLNSLPVLQVGGLNYILPFVRSFAVCQF